MNIYYTDGSASPNPGDGGWAVVLDGKTVASGAAKNTTNIRMEGYALGAAIQAGEKAGKSYKIITDSQFWCNVLTKWAPGWEQNGWKKKSRGKIENLDLVKKLFGLYGEAKPKIEWTRGHVGDVGNELADVAANRARENG
jgi:ribonuclease HI